MDPNTLQEMPLGEKATAGPKGTKGLETVYLNGRLLASPAQRAARLEAADAATKHNQKANIYLLKLAPEIRNRIYDFTIPHGRKLSNDVAGNIIVIMKGAGESGAPAGGFEPSILSVCRSLRSETVPVYYGRQNFQYISRSTSYYNGDSSNLSSLRNWIFNFGTERFRNIRRLEMNVDSRSYRLAFRLLSNTYSAVMVSNDMQPGMVRAAEIKFESVLELVKESMGSRVIVPPAKRPALEITFQ